MSPALLESRLPDLPPPRRGKVREVYDLGSELLIVATDRISAFDVVMATGVPDKGRILNQMSAYWFDRLGHLCPHHVVSAADAEVSARVGVRPELAGRCTVARKAKPLAIECVARGYLAGSWAKEYRTGARRLYGVDLPDGLVEGDRLPQAVFTPATKAEEGHDMNISFDEAADIVGREVADQVRGWTMELFAAASDHARSVGLILADTKFEFGLTDDGVIWIDEALTPDSSRFWLAEEHRPGGPQLGFDKQYVRDYLESTGWDKTPPGPALPDDVITNTRAKYLEAFRRVTGHDLAV
ncbi:MAG: phosphoribosylaminoimidazolesuccinocarboxamide synthase [Fimbriimonadaceae bacterium]|nr:phosphoribosylaminoimidazolesuccinocarboxamide synthase [Fimbriimonadaceae bacterium]